jgi:riboflavin-specific deaminase-like protein
VRRLFPDPGETSVEEQIHDLRLSERAHPDRPWVIVNFVTTLDGRATIAGRAGPIGSATDTEMLEGLRTQVDAVMIGAATMRVERYGRMVSDPQRRAWRERIGLAHDPLAVLISGRLDLPWEAPLFSEGDGRVVIFTTADTEPPETATPTQVVRQEGRGVDLAAALGYLREERGIRSLLSEGGPRTHAELWAAGLVDELFLTIAPKLAGVGGPSILEGELPAPIGLELVWLLEEQGELFARFQRRQ